MMLHGCVEQDGPANGCIILSDPYFDEVGFVRRVEGAKYDVIADGDQRISLVRPLPYMIAPGVELEDFFSLRKISANHSVVSKLLQRVYTYPS